MLVQTPPSPLRNKRREVDEEKGFVVTKPYQCLLETKVYNAVKGSVRECHQ